MSAHASPYHIGAHHSPTRFPLGEPKFSSGKYSDNSPHQSALSAGCRAIEGEFGEPGVEDCRASPVGACADDKDIIFVHRYRARISRLEYVREMA